MAKRKEKKRGIMLSVKKLHMFGSTNAGPKLEKFSSLAVNTNRAT